MNVSFYLPLMMEMTLRYRLCNEQAHDEKMPGLKNSRVYGHEPDKKRWAL